MTDPALPIVKGTLDSLVLKALSWMPMHGFEITQWVEARSNGALDVRDSELSPLPGGQLQSWTPRPRRALFHDQRTGDTPQPIIPFTVVSEQSE